MVSLASAEKTEGIIAPSAGGSLKRKHTEDPTLNAEHITASQLKKRKVTFDPEVDIRIVGNDNDKSLELVIEEVRRAIERHAQGEKAAYDGLKGLFKAEPTADDSPSSGLLQKYIIALANHAPLLDHDCKGLVHAAIDCSWVARNEYFVRSYRSFFRSLLSVQPGYLSTILQMLVTLFLDAPKANARQKDDPPVSIAEMQSRTHDFLKYILRSNPMASSFLSPVLASTFPFSDENAKTHARYIRNLLKIPEYCPEIKGEILSLVTDKLVKIDVQMQVDMEDLDDDLEEQLLGNATEDEDEEDDISDNESVSSEESLDPEEQRVRDIKEVILKLDTIMDLQFTYYDSFFEKGDRFVISGIFESLLSQFANIVLPTYRSRHTQFLLFHFSQISPDLVERFAGCCSHLAFDMRRPQLLRNSALAYLASFIARGAHVSGSIVRDIFDLLCSHLDNMRISHEPKCQGPDLRRYSAYYSISQALIYIFCFRWRDIIVTPDGNPPTDEEVVYQEGDFTWYNRTQEVMRRNIFCKLNPLKVCAPTIVAQFARMAHHLRFMYIYPLIETNKRVRLARALNTGYLNGIGGRETALSMKNGAQTFLLDAYFPFDPYVLPKSKRWLEGDYVQWKPVPGMLVEKDDDEDNEDDEDDDEDVDSDSSDQDEKSIASPTEAVNDSTEVSL